MKKKLIVGIVGGLLGGICIVGISPALALAFSYAPTSLDNKMDCKTVYIDRNIASADRSIIRCENDEVICYIRKHDETVQCKFKE